jgi:hypothetical protein
MRNLGTWVARGGVAAVVALLAAQAVPVERTKSPVTGDIGAPEPVAAILRRACYDCHSNETIWPWYGSVAPVSWLLAYDVAEGRRELNCSTWTEYEPPRRGKVLRESIEELREDEMPPWIYLTAHPEARLTLAERDVLLSWLAEVAAGAPIAARRRSSGVRASSSMVRRTTHDPAEGYAR